MRWTATLALSVSCLTACGPGHPSAHDACPCNSRCSSPTAIWGIAGPPDQLWMGGTLGALSSPVPSARMQEIWHHPNAGGPFAEQRCDPRGQPVTALWGSGASDVWAVTGNVPQYQGSPTTGSILHFDGSAWSVSYHAPAALWGIWGSGPKDVWAVGGNYAEVGAESALKNQGTILHWDGSHWSIVVSGEGRGYSAVGGSGPDDAWAGGIVWLPGADNGSGMTLHWNGTTWLQVPLPCVAAIAGIWASGPGDAWLIGDGGFVFHWDGSTWTDKTSQALPGDQPMDTVWGNGPNDVWLGGVGPGLVGTSYCDVAHWDGTSWRCETPPYPPPGVVRALWGTGPRDMYAVGVSGVTHWDGFAWSSVWAAVMP